MQNSLLTENQMVALIVLTNYIISSYHPPMPPFNQSENILEKIKSFGDFMLGIEC